MSAPTRTTLSLTALLDPEVLANPYPLYERLRNEAPVMWDPYLHAWVLTRYSDVADVLMRFKSDRTPTPERLAGLGMERLTPVAQVMVRQMIFMDPPQHGRMRGLAAAAFTPRRIELLRNRIHTITSDLLDKIEAAGQADVMADLANPLPAIVTAKLLGVPIEDHQLLRSWSEDFAEMLGNFQHNPGRIEQVRRSVEDMTRYFHAAIERGSSQPAEGLIKALSEAEVAGDRLSADEAVATLILLMVGGLETTTNLIGNGVLTLLRHPAALAQLRDEPSLMPGAVEEFLRFESPTQYTARLAPRDITLGGQDVKAGQAVIAVLGAANRDPQRFADAARLELGRTDNRHLAFGWGSHFCFGAPLARMEAQTALEALLRRLPNLRLDPVPLRWRPNLGLRGLTELNVRWSA